MTDKEPNGAVSYSVTCSTCGHQAWFTCHLYKEARAEAQKLGWGFHGMKTVYASVPGARKRQRAELGTVYCPHHQREWEGEREVEAARRARDAEAASLIAIAERPAKFREFAEALRKAEGLAEELDIFLPGLDFGWLAEYAESLAARERSTR